MCFSYAAFAVFYTIFSILFSPMSLSRCRNFRVVYEMAFWPSLLGDWVMVRNASCDDYLLLNL
jgi:hypothetical protein